MALTVHPTVETDPMPNPGDASDDMAVWVHPRKPRKSTVIGTDGTNGNGGLAVYDMSGRQIQYIKQGDTNNVDIRYHFPIGGKRVAIVAASQPGKNRVLLYTIDVETRMLDRVGKFRPNTTRAYGLAMYHDAKADKHFVFVNDPNGTVEQWRLDAGKNGKVRGTKVRSFNVGGTTEGMVADDELGRLYVAEELAGNIWRYGANPKDDDSRTLVDSPASGNLTAEVEGLAIYYAKNGKGYLIASSQGSNDYAVYRREGRNAFLTRFRIAANREDELDRVTDSDGIDVASVSLGPGFKRGAFLAQDGSNRDENINFKLVPWHAIVAASDGILESDTSQSPRRR